LIVYRLPGNRSEFAFSAGIVDRDVEAAKARNRAGDPPPDIVLVSHIRLNQLRFGTERLELGPQPLSGVLVTTGYDDAGAESGKPDGSGAAYTIQSAGDQ
jgi:hypothetical protein